MIARLATASAGVLDVLVPQRCAGCNAFGRELCDECRARFERMPLAARARLASDLEVIAFGTHDGALRHAVLAIKFRHFRSGARLLGEMVARRVSFSGDYLIPVPLHQARLRERGFNQADDIARGIGRVHGIPVAGHVIVRCRPTVAQSSLALPERRTNVSGAFAVGTSALDLSGAHLVLVDDVMTTGETLLACAAVLRKCGAAMVSAVVLARRL